MGLNFFAVAMKSIKDVSVFGLKKQGTSIGLFLPKTGEIIGASYGNKYVILDNNWKLKDLIDNNEVSLETYTDLIVGEFVESSNYSKVYELNKGKEIWSILHDINIGLDHLEISGDLPDGLSRFDKTVDYNSCSYSSTNEEFLTDYSYEIVLSVFFRVNRVWTGIHKLKSVS